MIRGRTLRDYAAGSLWVWPTFWALVALGAGAGLSQVTATPGSPLAAFAFQGTAEEARNLLTTVASTVVTVIALVLGLTVVALQLSSTQFSPRLLRNFLRDPATQRVLSVFMSTFTYSAAGLYTVGVVANGQVEDFPRLAVSGSIVLLFVTLGMVVYFADHLAHSIQIDAITEVVQTSTLSVVRSKPGRVEQPTPTAPDWAVAVASTRSGYLGAAYPRKIISMAARYDVCVLMNRMVGQHIVAGTTLAWVWRPTASDPTPDAAVFTRSVNDVVRIGFERTLEQDAAFGIRQLVDMACKALSPAVNDPYTAVQAIDHLSVIFCALARRPLGDDVATAPSGSARVIVPGRRFGDYLSTMCGLIRRYGSTEPTVAVGLLRLLNDCLTSVGDDRARTEVIMAQAALILEDAQRAIPQPADVESVRRWATALLQRVVPGAAV